jgi:hypothetical protein
MLKFDYRLTGSGRAECDLSNALGKLVLAGAAYVMYRTLTNRNQYFIANIKHMRYSRAIVLF